MLIAIFSNLKIEDFNQLISHAKRYSIKYSINKSNGNIHSVILFNPNPTNCGKWIERHGYSPMSLDLRSKS